MNAAKLEGRRIVITRTPAQSEEMTELLNNLGAEVVHFPTIKIVDPTDWSDLDAAIGQLPSYDWIVFTSANAVTQFFRRVAEKLGDTAAVAVGRICAIGPTTAKALRAMGSRVDVVAEDSTSEGAVRAITERLGGETGLRGLKFLVPRARVARDYLPEELRRLGAHVDTVVAYQTLRPHVAPDQVADLFAGRIDAITFTSPSTVANFAAIVGSKDLSGLIGDVFVVCIGPSTTAAAREYGLMNVAQPQQHTAAALVDSLTEALGRGKRG
ncbi:MAG TPA: uroporphyrinogen-III synthase [Blastocatellia bacterium]|nr:uroporphyrinogen-III synthase [Blastocatellia bacterium]